MLQSVPKLAADTLSTSQADHGQITTIQDKEKAAKEI